VSHPGDFVVFCQDRLGIEAVPVDGPVVPRAKLVDFVTVVSVHYPTEAAIEADEEKGVEAVPARADRTAVMYRVRRLNNAERPTTVVAFHVDVPTGETTPSLAGVWLGADWQEREQYDLVGTVFADHPDLRRIMMPEDWVGHPLRRDYAIETAHFPWR
jgi:NADH:ubiquinone oxidoreductase subunit C